MLCPECNTEWPDEVRYCGACGARMPDATVLASPYKVQVEASAPMATSPAPGAVDVPGAVDAAAVAAEPATLPRLERDVDLSVVGDAWRLLAIRKGAFFAGTLVVALASSALSSTVVGIVLIGPVFGGLAVASLRAASGRSVQLHDFFAGFTSFEVAKRLAIASLVTTLLVAVGSALLVVPGLYAAMVLAYAPFLVVDRGCGPIDALKQSVDAVHARLAAHVGLFAVLALVNVAGALLCGIGLLVTMPLTSLAIASAYERALGIRDGVDRLR